MITIIVAIVVAVISFALTRYFDRKFLAKTVSALKLNSEVVKYNAYKHGWADREKHDLDKAALLEEMKTAINK
jgi:hypothetical protein